MRSEVRQTDQSGVNANIKVELFVLSALLNRLGLGVQTTAAVFLLSAYISCIQAVEHENENQNRQIANRRRQKRERERDNTETDTE